MSLIWPFGARFFHRFKSCSREDFEQAAVEVAIVCVSAFLPLYAGIGFFSLTKIKGSAFGYAISFMTSGEMLLISCAIIGPLIYILSKRYRGFTDPLTLRFPYSAGFSFVIVMIWFVAGGIFVYRKASVLYAEIPNILDDDAMWDLSASISLAAIIVLYIATVFRNCMERIDPGALMHDQQEKFVRDFGNG